MFLICLSLYLGVLGMVVIFNKDPASVIATDADLLLLVGLSVVSTYPYIEVAQRTDGSHLAPETLSARMWRSQLQRTSADYVILSSRTHVLQVVYVILCVMNITMYAMYHFGGLLNRRNVLMATIVQTPFNSLAGLNPLYRLIVRTHRSRSVTSAALRTWAREEGVAQSNARASEAALDLRTLNRRYVNGNQGAAAIAAAQGGRGVRLEVAS
jgi:hypothetical protein